MGENSVDPDILKRTQDTLGQLINAPALTEKLLSRPPVQFLQDIVKTVCSLFLSSFFFIIPTK
jgi:TRAF3-interacting protein 1